MNRSNPADRLPKKQKRTRGDFGRGHLKVDNMLRDEDRDAYYALLRRPETTGRSAWEWLTARGYQITPGAVKRHKKRFDLNLKTIRRSAEMSLVCAELVRQVGPNKMSDAAVLRFETLLTQALFNYESGAALNKPEWQMLGGALRDAVTSRVRVEHLRAADESARREAGRAGRAGVRRPFDGIAIANSVRRKLGVPLPGEPTPGLRPALPAPPAADPPPAHDPPAAPPPADPPAPHPRHPEERSDEGSREGSWRETAARDPSVGKPSSG